MVVIIIVLYRYETVLEAIKFTSYTGMHWDFMFLLQSKSNCLGTCTGTMEVRLCMIDIKKLVRI